MAYSDIQFFGVETNVKDLMIIDPIIQGLDGVAFHSSDNLSGDGLVRITYTVEGTDEHQRDIMKKIRRLARGKPRFRYATKDTSFTGNVDYT